MAYHAAVLLGWTDHEHRRRHEEIAVNLERINKTTTPDESALVDPYEVAVLRGLGL
jgi:hypothetical protein